MTIRQYEPHDFAALYKLDQACFPAGIAYSKTMLRYFLTQPGAECLVALDSAKIVGFLLCEENPPLAHIVTLDVAESHRRHGVGTALMRERRSAPDVSRSAYGATGNCNDQRGWDCVLGAARLP